jgi:hypothetical protein
MNNTSITGLRAYVGIDHTELWSTDEATTDDLHRFIEELASHEYALLVLECKTNNNYLFLIPWAAKWHIRYSGRTEQFFVNGELTDNQVIHPEEIEFFDGQGVFCLTDELVHSATATAVAGHFIEYTRLLTPENHLWRWRDMLPL